jgi:transcriptional regulator with GAF, ATPase, and Fis domain
MRERTGIDRTFNDEYIEPAFNVECGRGDAVRTRQLRALATLAGGAVARNSEGLMSKEKQSSVQSTTSKANVRNPSPVDQDRVQWRRMRRARRAAVVQFRRTALAAPDLEAVLTDALEIATNVLDVELAKVLEHDDSHDNLIVRAANGWPTDVTGRVIEHAQGSSQAGYAFRTGHAVVVEDLRRVDAFRGTQLLHDHNVISGATVLIHGQSSPWGVLSVHSTTRRILTPDELDFLQAVADVIAAAVYRFVLARREGSHVGVEQHSPAANKR